MTPETESASPKPPRDDGLEWLREIRRQFAAECNYDPFEMGRRIRERQKEHPERICRTKRVLVPAEKNGVAAAPAPR